MIRVCFNTRKLTSRQTNETHIYQEEIMSKESQFLMRKGNRPYKQRRSRRWSSFLTLSHEQAGKTWSKRILCICRIVTSDSLLKLKDVWSGVLLDSNRLGLNFPWYWIGRYWKCSGIGSMSCRREKWLKKSVRWSLLGKSENCNFHASSHTVRYKHKTRNNLLCKKTPVGL